METSRKSSKHDQLRFWLKKASPMVNEDDRVRDAVQNGHTSATGPVACHRRFSEMILKIADAIYPAIR